MKKLIAAILIISCILSFSVCNADSTYWRFSTFGDSDQTNGIFDGDYFAFDLYMSPTTLTAFVQLTTWKNALPALPSTAEKSKPTGSLPQRWENV